jgi:hypothetical protein
MRRLNLTLIVLTIVAVDALFAVYVFNHTTEVLQPRVGDAPGITAMDRTSGGLITFGTEDGWILNFFSNYKNDAPITSLLMTDDGLMVAFADAANRVHLYFTGTGLLLWTRSFDSPVEVVDMWVRQGPFFLEPIYILVSYEGGFSLLYGPDGSISWSYSSDSPFVMRSTEIGKILVGSGSRVSYFFLGAADPYRWVGVEGPVVDLHTTADGNIFLLLTEEEAILYDGILGEVLWRRGIDVPVQATLSWDGQKSFLLHAGRLEVISKSGESIFSVDVGEGRLLAPSASSYYFMLREDRIDAYYDGRPAPIWTAAIGSPYEVYTTPGGTLIFAWTADSLYLLDNTRPPVASRAWVGIFGTLIVAEILVPLLLLLASYAPPSVGELLTSLSMGSLVGITAYLAGTFQLFVELGETGAFVAALFAASIAALLGRRSGSPIPGMTVGLVAGVISFLAASLVVAFYRYVFGFLQLFPAVETTIRSLTLGWLLGLVGGLLGGLWAYLMPDIIPRVIRRT